MTLDISTLLLLATANGLGLGGLSLALSTLQPGTRDVRLWGAAMLACSAGFALLYFHASSEAVVLLYGGWTGVLISVLLMYRALNRICGIEKSRIVFELSVLGMAVVGWLFFTGAQPNAFGHTGTVWMLASVVAARAAWDLWNRARGNRFSAPLVAMAVLLCALAATPLIALLLNGSAGGSSFSFAAGSPVVILGWGLGLAFLTVCVLWLEFSQLYATMENAGMYDVLTGLSNRQAIIAEIEGEHARSHRAKTPFSIALLEVDSFDAVNDMHGPGAGDQVLRWVAERIRRNIRPYDKVGRYGEEEFLVMMPNTSEKEALMVAERSRQSIQKQACVVNGKPLSVTVSIGVAVGERGADLDSVLFAADDAVSRARDKGRNSTVVAPLIGMGAGSTGAA